MKSETGKDNRLMLTVEAAPLAICTSRLDGSERHRIILDRDAAISLAGAIMVVAQHEYLQATGKLKDTATGANMAASAPMFTMRSEGIN